MPEKYKAEYKKKLDQTRVELADQVKSAVTEFENVTPTNDQLTDVQEAHFVVFESEEITSQLWTDLLNIHSIQQLKWSKICSDENKG
ncbi:iron-regulated surface protein [Staphylococcus aureus]|nr:iron-regulated surface protein [Staphylococcus aureus]